MQLLFIYLHGEYCQMGFYPVRQYCMKYRICDVKYGHFCHQHHINRLLSVQCIKTNKQQKLKNISNTEHNYGSFHLMSVTTVRTNKTNRHDILLVINERKKYNLCSYYIILYSFINTLNQSVLCYFHFLSTQRL